MAKGLLLGRTTDWGWRGEAQPEGPRGRQDLPGVEGDSILTFSFPSSSCLTSWGISKHLAINLQDSGIFFPPRFLPPLCFLFHNPRKPEQPEGLTQHTTPAPLPHDQAPPSLFCLSRLPHFPRPQQSPAPDFLVPGSGRAWPWVWWSEPWLAGRVGLAFPAPFLRVGRPPWAGPGLALGWA